MCRGDISATITFCSTNRPSKYSLPPTQSPSVSARSAERRCDRSVISSVCNVFWNTDFVTPLDMLAELRDDNKQLAAHLRETHGLCDEHGDVASASLLESWIDEAE